MFSTEVCSRSSFVGLAVLFAFAVTGCSGDDPSGQTDAGGSEDTVQSTEDVSGEDTSAEDAATDTSGMDTIAADTADTSTQTDTSTGEDTRAGDTDPDGAADTSQRPDTAGSDAGDAGDAEQTQAADGGADTLGQMCGGSSGVKCPKGKFCKKPAGSCGSKSATGHCKEIPSGCPKKLDPVCGCDGNTYQNPCLAEAKSVNIDHKGSCAGSGQTCGQRNPCPSSEYCHYSNNSCGAQGATGTCKTRPLTCGGTSSKVCGCDGNTYPSDCDARRAGVDVAHSGKCSTSTTQCSPSKKCPTGQYCDYPNNTCGQSGQKGTCKPKPTSCPIGGNKVCGCDASTHANDCVAYSNGTDIDHMGKCNP